MNTARTFSGSKNVPYENLKLTNDCPTVKSFTQLIFTISVVKSMVVVVDVSVDVVVVEVVVSQFESIT